MLHLDDYADDVLLPEPEDRKWMLDNLAGLMKMAGYEPFVIAPLIESDERFFPDPWKGGELSFARLARRLLHYAGIDDLDVRARIFDEDEPMGDSRGPTGRDFGIWFDGIKSGVCRFGAYRPFLGGPLEVVAGTARAVADAWRWNTGLVSPTDKKLAEQLLDLTTIYLGFGLITTDATSRHTTEFSGRRAKRDEKKLGVTSSRAMAFMLAAQAVARGLDKRETKQLARKLQTNQGGLFRNAVAFLEKVDPPMRAWLELPPEDQWPAPPDIEELTAPAEDEGVEEEEETKAEAPKPKSIEGSNEGKPVFMVERSAAMTFAKLLVIPAGGLAMVAKRLAPPDMNIGLQQIIPVVATLFVAGVVAGSFFTERTCSDPACGSKLKPDDSKCPKCGGDVKGKIGHKKERLAAEERLSRGSDDPEGA